MGDLSYNVHPEPIGKWGIKNQTTAMISTLTYQDIE